jgi:hypothetical protein
MDGRGLAGAIWADDAEDLAVSDIEAQVRDGLKSAEALAQVGDGKELGHAAGLGRR